MVTRVETGRIPPTADPHALVAFVVQSPNPSLIDDCFLKSKKDTAGL